MSYLKELPECLSVVSLLAVKSLVFLEVPINQSINESQHLHPLLTGCGFLIQGDDTSLHNLLLQPVQRIPEYLLLLQVSPGPGPQRTT